MADTRRIAEVVTLPARTVGDRTASIASGAVSQVRAWTADHVDDWGRDPGFVDRVHGLGRLRWDVCIGGIDHVPARAGALVVVNARRFALAAVMTALAIGEASGRSVRFAGRPDTAPLGPLLQRLGGLPAVETDIEGALRAGEIVIVAANPSLDNRRSGAIDHRLVGAAVAARVRALPTATISSPLHRRARVEIGAPIRPDRARRGPLAELELADLLGERIDAALSELGGTVSGTPLDWLGFGPVGRS